MKREHDTNGPFCWCGPTLETRCRTCNGRGREEGSEVNMPCWRCHGKGMVEGHPEETGLLIIHRDVEELEDEAYVDLRGLMVILFAAAVLVICAAIAVMWGRGGP